MKIQRVLSQTKTLQRMQTYLQYFVLVLSLSLMTSCSEFLKGKPKSQDFIEIQSASLGCLEDVSKDLSQFFKAEAGPEAVDKTLNCITKTITEFQKKVEGRSEASAFTADEVYDIFTKFVSQAKLSKAAAQNIILLKSAILGGSSSKVTKAELSDLIKYLQIVSLEAKKLAPYVKVFSFKKTEKAYSKEFITNSFEQLGQSLKILLRTSKLSNSSYSFTDFKNLVVNVLNLADKEQNLAEIVSKINYVLNGYQTELTDVERDEYIDSITDLLEVYAMYSNAHFKFDLRDFENMDSSFEFVNQIVKLVENSLQYRKTAVISSNSLDRLFIEISKSDLLSNQTRASSLINFYKAFAVRFLESAINGQPQNFTGLKSVHFANLKRELAVYQIYGRLVKQIFSNNLTNNGETHFDLTLLQSKLASLNPANEQDILSQFNTAQQFTIINIVNEVKSEFLKAQPSTVYYSKRLVLAQNKNIWKQSKADLVEDMKIKLLSRLLMLGYGAQYQPAQVTTTKLGDAAYYLWYSEFKALLIDMKFFDPRTVNAGTTSVTVANLFTQAGNGDNDVTYTELNQYFGTLIAGSGSVSDEMYKDLDEKNCQLPELDVFGKHWNIETCLDQLIQEKYKQYFAHLPHMLTYLETLSPVDFNKYFRELTSVMRYETASEGKRVESSDLSGLNTIAYFIEATYLLHDTNKNGLLSDSEVRTAYPKFKTVARDFAYSSSAKQIKEFSSWKATIAGLGCHSEEDLIRESFIFLVFKGRTPKTSDLNLFSCFTGKPLITFKGEVDRLQLTQALKSLKSILAP